MYKLRFTVYDGEIGKADQLGISFDESLTTDEVRVDLSDDVLNGRLRWWLLPVSQVEM